MLHFFLVHPSTPAPANTYHYANCCLSHTSLYFRDDVLIVRNIYIENFYCENKPIIVQEVALARVCGYFRVLCRTKYNLLYNCLK